MRSCDRVATCRHARLGCRLAWCDGRKRFAARPYAPQLPSNGLIPCSRLRGARGVTPAISLIHRLRSPCQGCIRDAHDVGGPPGVCLRSPPSTTATPTMDLGLSVAQNEGARGLWVVADACRREAEPASGWRRHHVLGACAARERAIRPRAHARRLLVVVPLRGRSRGPLPASSWGRTSAR